MPPPILSGELALRSLDLDDVAIFYRYFYAGRDGNRSNTDS